MNATLSAVAPSDACQVSIFKLPQIISFIAVPARVDKIEAYDLIENATSVPDPKVVDALLAERLAPLIAGIEAKAQVKQAEKQQEKTQQTKSVETKKAIEAVEQKQLAEVTEAKPLAAEAEKKTVVAQAAEKSAAVEAEKKMIWEKEEAKRLAEQAEKKKLAEAAAQKQLAEKAAQEKAKQEKMAQEKAAQEKKAEAVVEETPATIEKPEAMAPAPVSESQTDMETKKKGTKGLDDLLYELAKNAALMLGALILLYLGFKFIFRSKKPPKET